MSGTELMMFAAMAASATAAVVQGESQAAMLKAQARQAEEQGELARQAASADASAAAEDADRTIGSAIAIAGASGFDVSGSALDVLADLAGQKRYNTNAIIYGGDMARRDLLASASNFRVGGRAARTTGYLSAASTVMSGGYRMRQTQLDRTG